MSQFRYRPAAGSGWVAVASPGALLVVHPRAADAAVRLFDGDHGDSRFQAALEVLTAGGLSLTPPFALLEWTSTDGEQQLRVIVRGDVVVEVMTAGEPRTMNGAGVSTWTEQAFSDVTAFEVRVAPEPDEVLDSDRWLPLASGVAVVSRIALADGPVIEAALQRAAPEPKPAPAAVKPAPEAQASEPVSEATMGGPSSETAVTPPVLDADARPTDDGYDYLFGETMYRNVAEAAVREPEAEPEAEPADVPAASPPPPPAGDHDGMTIMTGDLKKLRGARKAPTAAPPSPPPAPELFLELSNGTREALSQPLLVGRAPTASKVSGAALPKLVTIPGDKDISRTHAQFAVEGGTVVVTDLHSRNGTQVILPGKAPQQLRQGEPTAVIVGTVVDLGGGVTLTVREEA